MIKVIKPTRTISGVAPLAVMLPPRACPHGTCLYCPALNSPQSYTPKSPVVMRASQFNYDAGKQVEFRLKTLNEMGHSTDKIELIIMGGTFLSFPEDFQFDYIKRCYDALNGKSSKTLEQAKKLNENAEHRCVALCIETRPDFCGKKQIENMMKFGCTRVELGVQALDNKIYKINKRGHNVKDVIDATRRLKEAGFKVGYHIMTGLPGSNPRKDLQMFKKIFSSSDFRPDQLKIYPCQVIKGAKLEELHAKGKYKPYSEKQTSDLIVKMMQSIPEYCRVMRIMREIPPAYLVAGISNLGLRKEIEDEIRRKNLDIKEIRFREIGFTLRDKRELSQDIGIKKTEYKASKGNEIFIQAVNKDNILFGLLRLRLQKKMPAMIRELHVYGPVVELGKKDEEKFQHKGLGKELMAEAEKIAKKAGFKSIRVISGVGVREYYRTLGYELDKEEYMSRTFI